MGTRGRTFFVIHGLLAAIVLAGCTGNSSSKIAVLSTGVSTAGRTRTGTPPPTSTTVVAAPTPNPIPTSGGTNEAPQPLPVPSATTSPVIGSGGSGGGIISDAGALLGSVRAPASLVSNNGGGIIANNSSRIITDNGSGLIGNNGGSIITDNGSGLIGNNGGSYRLADVEGPETALTQAFMYLTDRDERFYFNGTKPYTTTTDGTGRYSFGVVPAGKDMIVNAALNNNLRLSGYMRTNGGAANTLVVNFASTMATEFLRGEAYRLGRALSNYDFTAFTRAVSQTDAAIATGDIAAVKTVQDQDAHATVVGPFDFRIDHLAELRNQYVIAISAVDAAKATVKTLSDTWKAILGVRPAAVTSVLGNERATPTLGGSFATFGFATGDQRDANGLTGPGVGTPIDPAQIPLGYTYSVCTSKGGDVFVGCYTSAAFSGHVRWIHPDGRITSLWLPTYPLGIITGLCVEKDAPAGSSLDAVQETDDHGTLLVSDARYNMVYRVPIVDHAVWTVPGAQERYFMEPVAGDVDDVAPGQIAAFYQQVGPSYVNNPAFVDGAAAEPPTDAAEPKTSNWRASEEGPRTYRGSTVGQVDTQGVPIDPSLQHSVGDPVANPARYAHLDSPSDVKVDEVGNIYISDQTNHRIRFIPSAAGIAAHANYFGYRAPTTDANGFVTGFASSPTPMQAGCMYTIVGNPTWDPARAAVQNNGKWFGEYQVAGQPGDSVRAQETHLDQPYGIAVHAEADGTYLYIADFDNQRIRRVSRNTGVVSTFAGAPPEPQLNNGLGDYNYPLLQTGDGGDGGQASAARLSSPKDIAFDPQGRAFIVDADSGRIRMVDSHGVITTVAGRLHAPNTVQTDNASDGEALRWVDLFATEKLAVDLQGNLVFCDLQHQRLRKLWRQWE